MKRTEPEVIELDQADLESRLDQIEAVMGADMARPFRQILRWYLVLQTLVREKKLSILRFRNMLFGASTERSANVLPSPSESSVAPEETSAAPPTTAETSSPTDQPESTGNTPGDAQSPRRPGHGRIPASQYTGCTQVIVTHESLRPGDACPQCGSETLYRQSDWSPVVRLKGQPPVGGQVYQLEKLRCHACGKTYTAELPEEAGTAKHDATVASIVATLRYGEGMPWNRLRRLQQLAGVPLPASVQWEVVRDAAEQGPRVAFEHLLWLGAQGELVHNDDTPMQVLELTGKRKRQEPLLEDDPERRGVFTTAILSLAEERPTIALFFTGPHHAGENLRTLLEARLAQQPPPIQMCDALSRNMPDDLRVILANCLSHGRRNFVEVVTAFPDEVRYVLECLKKVYQTDAQAKQQQLSPDERLRLHQQQSGPVMDELHRWLQQQFEEKLVEPNSSLGGAIAYMLKHWEKLTLFLRVAGAPLDNNACEQALKMAIRHRKNSLFYKTMRGAEVGDLYMSLIHTCYLSDADPFGYLTELQRHHERVRMAPGDWMPWNYRQQLVAAEAETHESRASPGEATSLTSPSPGT